jgi:O-succinylbenzoate synthase
MTEERDRPEKIREAANDEGTRRGRNLGGDPEDERLLTPEFLGLHENREPLWIERIRVLTRSMDLRIPFETSFGRFASLVRLYPEITFRTEGGRTVTGLGECSPLSAPWYDYECHRSVATALGYIVATLTGKSVEAADGLASGAETPVTGVRSFVDRYRWIVGHNMSKAGVEGAYWDAVAKLRGLPVWELWGGTRSRVEAGTSVGLEPTLEALMEKIDRAVEEMKVARVKVKVKPGRDLDCLEAIRNRYPDLRLQADANAAYDLFDPAHLARLKEFDRFGLTMIEQPGPNDDILDHARQLAHLSTPICLDESILHATHARQAIQCFRRYSSPSRLIVNIKPPRVGGYLEAIRIAALCRRNGVSVWCGGMHESALGKTANVHFCSRAEVDLPGDHVSQAPYFVRNVGASPRFREGWIDVPRGVGWGIEDLDLED